MSIVAQVRGSLFINTFAFLREVAGPEAPQKVLSGLPADVRVRLERPIRESSWAGFDDLMLYMRAAKALFAPDDPQFYRRMGYFAGQRLRQHGGFEAMVPEPKIAVQMSRLVWLALFDVGRVEVAGDADREAQGTIHDFPADEVHCQRLCGALEGLLTAGSNIAQAEEIECAAKGAPNCRFRVRWV